MGTQHDFVLDNQSGASFRTDANSALQALANLSAGANAPTTTYPNMLWYEEDTDTLWQRNEANTAWIKLATYDQTNNRVIWYFGVEPLVLEEVAADPSALANNIKIYGKDVGGVTELHTRDSAGNILQLTTAGALKVTGQEMGIEYAIGTIGGGVIATGDQGHLVAPFGFTITEGWLTADQSGSIVIDIWKDTYANYPPTDADSITASAPLTISAATKSKDTTLTGWTTSVSKGDILRFNVDSVSSINYVLLTLLGVKT